MLTNLLNRLAFVPTFDRLQNSCMPLKCCFCVHRGNALNIALHDDFFQNAYQKLIDHFVARQLCNLKMKIAINQQSVTRYSAAG